MKKLISAPNKNLFANKLSHFLESKFGMICPKQSEAQQASQTSNSH